MPSRRLWALLGWLAAAFIALVCASPNRATAAEVAEPVLEQRVTRLTEELRCLVCQNQTIADSHAELANDLRQQVREKLAQGLSDAEVRDFMVARYGDFVLYRPPVKRITWALWFGPFLLLAAGLAWLFSRLRQRQHEQDAMDPNALAHAAALLATPAHSLKNNDEP